MATVSIRDLSRHASRVVDDVARTGRPVLVTKHGEPVAALIPISADDLEGLVRSQAPKYLADLSQHPPARAEPEPQARVVDLRGRGRAGDPAEKVAPSACAAGQREPPDLWR
jgi:prevent-host-death family protein